MKTSTAMRRARGRLRFLSDQHNSYAETETFACWAISHATHGRVLYGRYKQALERPEVKAFSGLLPKRIQGSDNVGLSEYRWFNAMSYEDRQNFRFLLLCVAEEYFKSIGD